MALFLPFMAIAAISHSMSLSRDTGEAIFVTKFAGMQINRRDYKLEELQSCVLEYNRGTPRLSIVLKNGLTTTPLDWGFDPAIGTVQVQQGINKFLGATNEN